MFHTTLNQTILALYRGCRDQTISNFKHWAMEIVRAAVNFDSGIWATSDIVSDDFNCIYLFHQPPELIHNYNKHIRISGDHLAKTALASPGRTIRLADVCPSDRRHEIPTFWEHCSQFGIEHALCTCPISPVAQIPTGLSFYRAAQDSPFTDEDRETVELLVPHMIEAMRLNLFSFMNSPGIRTGDALAICDGTGVLYETTPRFPELMTSKWPDWRGPQLKLPFASLAGHDAARWTEHGLTFEAKPCRDLYLLRMTMENPLDRLSPRQRDVAEMLAKGMRYKNIARDLDISPSTVTKHVNQIHLRLEIGGREELIRLVDSANWNAI